MSSLGERIGRRLAKRHGFQFTYDPCNFFVWSDREGVERNNRGGQGVMQWQLSVDCKWHKELPLIQFKGKEVTAEIGSDFGGSTCVNKWKYWRVTLYAMSGQTPIFWIDRGKDKDETFWEERR